MQHAVGIFDVLLCVAADQSVLSLKHRVLAEGAKPRNQRRKRHDDEGPESLHSGAREGVAGPGYFPPALLFRPSSRELREVGSVRPPFPEGRRRKPHLL